MTENALPTYHSLINNDLLFLYYLSTNHLQTWLLPDLDLNVKWLMD